MPFQMAKEDRRALTYTVIGTSKSPQTIANEWQHTGIWPKGKELWSKPVVEFLENELIRRCVSCSCWFPEGLLDPDSKLCGVCGDLVVKDSETRCATLAAVVRDLQNRLRDIESRVKEFEQDW